LPIFVVGGFFPLKPISRGAELLGQFLTVAWTAATVVHLHSLTYIYSLGFEKRLLLPLIWTTLFCVYARAHLYPGTVIQTYIRRTCAMLLLVVPWFGIFRGGGWIEFALAVGHLVFAAHRLFRQWSNLNRRTALFLGAAGVLVVLPPDVAGPLLAFLEVSTGAFNYAMVSAAVAALLLTVPQPITGILGALIAGLGGSYALDLNDVPGSGFHLFSTILFMHLLSWRIAQAYEQMTYCAACMLFMVTAWVHGGPQAHWISIVTCTLLLVVGVATWFFLRRKDLGAWMGLAAVVPLLIPAFRFMFGVVSTAPGGTIPLFLAFLLLAGGTLVAVTKRSRPHENPPGERRRSAPLV
jgi:hypothetical protein